MQRSNHTHSQMPIVRLIVAVGLAVAFLAAFQWIIAVAAQSPTQAAPQNAPQLAASSEREMGDIISWQDDSAFILASIGPDAPKQNNAAAFRISPAVQYARPGGVLAVTVEAVDLASSLSGFQLDLSYDPAILEFVRLQSGSFLGKSGRSTVCAAPAAPAPGVVRIACASAGEVAGPSGSGPLAVLIFAARSQGASALTLSGLQAAGAGVPPASLAVSGINGQVQVTAQIVYLPLVARAPAGSSSLALPEAAQIVALPPIPPSAPVQTPCDPADLNCDHRVDEADLGLATDHWNCLPGNPCYAAAFDLDGSGRVDSFDLAWVGNEYDIRPPEIAFLAPLPGSSVDGPLVQVSGVVTDAHPVTSVTVNGVAATLNANGFTVALNLADGNRTLVALAADKIGLQGTASQVVGVDGSGPLLEITAPQNRQSVYTLTPAVEISANDFYASVDPATWSVQLIGPGGAVTPLTGDLTVDQTGARGALKAPLTGDAVYTLTASVADTWGNLGSAQAAFYVPPNPAAILPPLEPEGAGWVDGVVYDSSTCNDLLTSCAGLPGASVTLAISGGAPVAGEIITGPDGFFAFPLAQTGEYWLRVTKPGFTYGQRAAEVVRQRSTATNEIYLTPLDAAVTYCDQAGCNHLSSDGVLQVEIPAGAIPAGEIVTTTATNFDQVEFLPSGELPPGTWETYAFNLGGDSEITFTAPITVRQANSLGFDPGSEIPLGYWNQRTLQWEHAGFGVVDPSGQWVVMTVTHFSNFDPNYPISISQATPKPKTETEEDKPCAAKDTEGSIVYLKSGRLVQEVSLPPVKVMGVDTAPSLRFSSERASPSQAIDVQLSVEVGAGAQMGDYVGYDLYIQGIKTASFTFSSTLDGGEVGRYRYLWDGRDAQGNLLSSGIYDYRVDLSIPYRAQYCGATRFGGPPDCVRRPTGRFVEATQNSTTAGTVALENGANSPFGAGWALNGLQRLTVDEAGHILVTDGERSDEFYFYPWDLTSGGDSQLLAEQAVLLQEQVGSNLVELAPDYPTQANRLFRYFDILYENNAFTMWLNSTAGVNAQAWYSKAQRFESQDGLVWYNRTDTNLVKDGDRYAFLIGPREIIHTGDLYQAWEAYYWTYSRGWADGIRYITSTNGLDWTVANDPALVGTKFPNVIRVDDTYHLWSNPDGDGLYTGSRSLRHRASASPGAGWGNWQTDGQLVKVDGVEVVNAHRVRRTDSGVYQLFYFTGDQELTLSTSADGTSFSGAQKIIPPLSVILPGFNRLRDFNVIFAQGREWIYFTYNDSNNVAHMAVYPMRPVVVSRTATDFSTLSYNETEQIYIRTYPDGRKVYFDRAGRHHYTVEPTGQVISYTYGAQDLLTAMEIRLPGETTARWRWTFDYTGGRLSAITDPAGRVTRFTIDEHNHLTAITDPDGVAQQFAYSQDHWMTHAVDKNGAITEYTYDAYGRLTSYIKPARPVYDPASGQVKMMREVRTFTPSDTSYPLINQSPLGDPVNPAPSAPTSAQLVDQVNYGRGGLSGHTDQWGSWLDKTDGEGNKTTYQYDHANNLIRANHPDGSCTLYSYDAVGNKLSEKQMAPSGCASGAGESTGWTYTYESRFHQLKTQTDPRGNTTTYWYDYELGLGEAGKLARIVQPQVANPAGGFINPTQNFTYNAWGQLIMETDPLGIITLYRYTQGTPDEAFGGANAVFALGVTPVPGLLTQVIRDLGPAPHLNATTIYRDFNAAGYPGAVIGPGCCDQGQLTSYIYDAWNRVLTEKNALGIVTRYEYDGQGNLVRRTQDYTPDGVTGRNVSTEMIYDAEGLLLSRSTAADGALLQESYYYDINRQLAAQADSLGYLTRYEYDDANRLVRRIDPAGYVYTTTYTANGGIETMTDPSGSVTRYGYDGFGRLVTETVDANGLKLTTLYAYDLAGNLVILTDPSGAEVHYQYDSLGRQTGETQYVNSAPFKRASVYDAAGRMVQETDWRGVKTLHTFDALGREVQMVEDAGGLNLTTVYTYNLAGAKLAMQNPQGTVTTYGLDALNRVVQQVEDANGLALKTLFTYDRLGRRLTITNPRGVVAREETNAFGLLVYKVEDAGGLNVATTFSYDGNLNLQSVHDANDHLTAYQYDRRNMVTQTLYADGAAVTSGFDDAGRLAWQTDQAGERMDFSYDGAGRLAGRAFSDGSTQSFAYDASGRLVLAEQSMNGHTTRTRFAFNELGDVVSATQTVDGLSWTILYNYDYALGLATITYPSGAQVERLGDGRNRLSQVSQDGALVAAYTYASASGAMTVTLDNGVDLLYQTDALGRITRAASPLADYRYGYDQAGNRTFMQRWHESGHPADVYQYDALNRLVRVWTGATSMLPAPSGYQQTQAYKLDMLGNRLLLQTDGVGLSYLPNDGVRLTDAMNRYRQVDQSSLTYDANGNLLSDGVNSYTYDALNRQAAVTAPGGAAEYIYDALGRRVAKIVGGATTYFVYNAKDQIIEERGSQDQLLARYIYGSELDELLSMERGGHKYYFQRDALGSITEAMDDAGTLVERYEYDVYGQPAFYNGAGNPLAGSAIGNPYLFTGRQYDAESGNYYYRARIYHPALGRFVQMDPVGYTAGWNLYEYVGSNPVNRVDPSGLWWWYWHEVRPLTPQEQAKVKAMICVLMSNIETVNSGLMLEKLFLGGNIKAGVPKGGAYGQWSGDDVIISTGELALDPPGPLAFDTLVHEMMHWYFAVPFEGFFETIGLKNSPEAAGTRINQFMDRLERQRIQIICEKCGEQRTVNTDALNELYIKCGLKIPGRQCPEGFKEVSRGPAN